MQTDLLYPKASSRVLVVDDEPAILFAYVKLIQGEGFCVDACEGLDEALCLIDMHPYFAVITDIRLSGSEQTEGVRLMHAVHQRQPDSKVIVVTGYGNNTLMGMLKDSGASYYFEKPVKPSEILSVLKQLHLKT